MHRLNAPELANPLPFTPAEEISGGAAISRPSVAVADIDDEVFEEAQRGPIPGPGDERGKRRLSVDRVSSNSKRRPLSLLPGRSAASRLRAVP
jgi:hypothetical protein